LEFYLIGCYYSGSPEYHLPVVLVPRLSAAEAGRLLSSDDATIISSISVTEIVFAVFWGNGIIEAFPKLKLGDIF
jgi:hypothetical protein